MVGEEAPSDIAVAQPTAPRSPLRRFLFAFAILSLLCLFSAPLYVNMVDSTAPVPSQGAVSYVGWQSWSRPVSLAGGWRLVWRAPAAPGGVMSGDSAVARVPGAWEGLRTQTGGQAVLPKFGLATYQLTLRGVPPGRYTLFVPTLTHASRVWVNGRVVGQMGQVGDSARTTRYVSRAQPISIEADGSDLHLAIDVAAFLHNSDGIDSAPVLGLAEVMDGELTKGIAQQLFFIVTLIILFFYGAIVFAFRSKDHASLCFALSCILLVPTSMVIGHDDLLTLLYPALSYRGHMAVEYLTCIIAFMFLVAYPTLLFPGESSRRVFWIFEALFSVGLLVVGYVIATGDTVLASNLDRFPMFLAAIELLYVIGVVLLATFRGRDGAAVFLLGVSVFAASIFEAIIAQYDIVPRDKLIGYDYAAMGLLVFAVSHIIILAERWSLAMGATEAIAVDLQRLMEVSSSITSEVRLDALLKKLIEATSKFLQADRSTLFLHDPKADQLWSMVAEGIETGEIRMPSDTGIAGASFSSGQESIVNDPYADPRFNRSVDETTGYRTKGILTLPILTRDGRRLGVMQALNRRDGHPFEPADVQRMRAFAAHAAVAIDNASLFSDIVAARNYNDSILASMSGGVITLDAQGRIETINTAAAVILDVDPDRIRGLSAAEALSEANAWLTTELDAVRADKQARAMLDVEIHISGDRVISVNLSIVPLLNDQVSAGLLVLFEDISQEKRLKGVMRRFMTQRVVDQVLGREDELQFGSACVASVLFADIRGFTSMAESLKARETVDMLNEVFTDLVEAVSSNDGVVDKFIGDAVMAVFGAPISSGRDAQNAVESANAMMRLVAALNKRREARGDPPLRLGIGVATGELIAGAIGSPKRMDYTVIGDSVNLASRVQDLTKTYGVGVIVCEATAHANADNQILRHLDTVNVRGRNRPERLYQLLTYHTADSFPHLAEVIAAYGRGVACRACGDWPGAVDAFAEALALNPGDRPSEMMLAHARAAVAEVAAAS